MKAMLRTAGIGAAAIAFVAGAPVFAQCPLCRTALAAQGSAAAGTFDHAILVLLIPAVSLFCGVFLFAFRHAGSAEENRPEAPPRLHPR